LSDIDGNDEAGGAQAAPEPPRKRGRPRKLVSTEQLTEKLADVRRMRQAKVRHDADDAPIDGDYDPLRLTNEDPGFKYFWASERDRARLGHRGWIEERWSPACARPRFYFGPQKRGEMIRERELVLMKLPAEVWRRQQERDPQRRRHAELMQEILHPSKPGHQATFKEQTLVV
jgi:hypothetical protein